ncbi:MAG: class I SAM-dependent methyltransferase [Leptolyngbyaceae cyanobacterium bins.59]|nr:class I SAM-dependent methyltransferase [Leptolyngbyaceae cyanobacterium bins.59]
MGKNPYEQAKHFLYSSIRQDYDLTTILMFFDRYLGAKKETCRLLDVGCGYGEKLKGLQKAGYHILGVEINPEIVKKNQANGLNCITVDDFEKSTDTFDGILMSHIIEHFDPVSLKEFMDSYLDRLNRKGFLVIATPLMSDSFYNDFDHIKPYQPFAILNVFGSQADHQVQYYSRNKLDLKDLYFRKRHYRPVFFRSLYIRSSSTKILQLLEFSSAILWMISGGIIGQKDGWVGIFQKR